MLPTIIYLISTLAAFVGMFGNLPSTLNVELFTGTSLMTPDVMQAFLVYLPSSPPVEVIKATRVVSDIIDTVRISAALAPSEFIWSTDMSLSDTAYGFPCLNVAMTDAVDGVDVVGVLDKLPGNDNTTSPGTDEGGPSNDTVVNMHVSLSVIADRVRDVIILNATDKFLQSIAGDDDSILHTTPSAIADNAPVVAQITGSSDETFVANITLPIEVDDSHDGGSESYLHTPADYFMFVVIIAASLYEIKLIVTLVYRAILHLLHDLFCPRYNIRRMYLIALLWIFEQALKGPFHEFDPFARGKLFLLFGRLYSLSLVQQIHVLSWWGWREAVLSQRWLEAPCAVADDWIINERDGRAYKAPGGWMYFNGRWSQHVIKDYDTIHDINHLFWADEDAGIFRDFVMPETTVVFDDLD